jgi:SAM-dependent methyltransferase
MSGLTAAEFDCFSTEFRRDHYAAQLASEAGFSTQHAHLYLNAIINEAHLALRLLKEVRLDVSNRVLEVGAGAGLLTAFLQSRGCNLVAIEPVDDGFEATPILSRIVRESTGISPHILHLEARELDCASHGLFDVIFSINVIEHFQPLGTNLAGMARVLSPRGVQIHTCPNYSVPYEPHFGIPLLPFAPHLTVGLWRRELRDNPLWRSLNFITATDLRNYAAQNGLDAVFARGAMGRSLRRLREEPEFAARHPAVLRWMAQIAHHTGLARLLGQLPAALSTPMTVVLRPKSPIQAM